MRLFFGMILFALGIGATNAQTLPLAPMPAMAVPSAPVSSGDAALAPLDLTSIQVPDGRDHATTAAMAPVLPLAPLPASTGTTASPSSFAASKPVSGPPATAAVASSRPAPPPHQEWSSPSSAGTALAPLPESEANALARVTTTFAIRQGETLQAALTRWCNATGWTLVWKSTRDYRIEAAITFPSGTAFDDAVHDTMRSIWRMSPTVKSTLYTRNRVLLLSEVNG